MRINECFLFVSLIFFISCSADVSSLTRKGKVYFLSIGIEYSDSKVSTLYGTESDAAETAMCFYQIYKEKNIECIVEIMRTGTKDEDVMRAIENIDCIEDDLIIFYFSGHGSIDSIGPFLACSSDKSDYSRLYMNEIFDALNSKGCRCVVFLDCCYAGAMAENTTRDRGFGEAIKEISTSPENNRVCVISSCQSDQLSMLASVFTIEGDGEHHSLFTLSLLRVLGWKHSSSVSTDDVCGFLSSVPKKMSVYELFDLISDSWNSQTQNPVINRTEVPVLIIP